MAKRMNPLTPNYKSSDEFSPDAFQRRMQQMKKKKKRQNASGIKTDESKDDQGNSKLSTIRKVTDY